MEKVPHGEFGERVDDDQREHRQQDDHDAKHGDQRRGAADRADLVARHLARGSCRRGASRRTATTMSCTAPAKIDADDDPDRARQVAHLGGQHGADERPGAGDRGEVVAEQHAPVGRLEVLAVLEVLGRRGAAVVRLRQPFLGRPHRPGRAGAGLRRARLATSSATCRCVDGEATAWAKAELLRRARALRDRRRHDARHARPRRRQPADAPARRRAVRGRRLLRRRASATPTTSHDGPPHVLRGRARDRRTGARDDAHARRRGAPLLRRLPGDRHRHRRQRQPRPDPGQVPVARRRRARTTCGRGRRSSAPTPTTTRGSRSCPASTRRSSSRSRRATCAGRTSSARAGTASSRCRSRPASRTTCGC